MHLSLQGDTPMRRLVYRVKRLPMSLLPLVWDFGQLDAQTEKLYIKQLVRQYVSYIILYSVINKE